MLTEELPQLGTVVYRDAPIIRVIVHYQNFVTMGQQGTWICWLNFFLTLEVLTILQFCSMVTKSKLEEEGLAAFLCKM